MPRRPLLALIAIVLGACSSVTPTATGPGGATGPSSSGSSSSGPGSSDGSAGDVPPGWTRSLVPTLDGIATIGRLAAGAGGLTAFGNFSAWHSSDATTWASVQVPIENPRALLVSGQGPWVAGGFGVLPTATGSATGSAPSGSPSATQLTSTCASGPTVQAQLAWSADGATWTSVAPDPAFRTYFVGQLTAGPTGTGYWTVGSNSCAEGLPPRSQAWFSPDGTAWAPKAGAVASGLMIGIAALGDRLVAVGGRTDDPGQPEQALVWTLNAGASGWSQPRAIGTHSSTLRQVTVVGSTVYAWSPASQDVWASKDLVTWTDHAFPDVPPHDIEVVTTSSGSWLAGCSDEGIFGLTTSGSWVRLAGGSDHCSAITAGSAGVTSGTSLIALGQTVDGRGVVWIGPATAPQG